MVQSALFFMPHVFSSAFTEIAKEGKWCVCVCVCVCIYIYGMIMLMVMKEWL
jgi:hypothetical protein